MTTRRIRRAATLVLPLLVLVSASRSPAQDMSDVEIRIIDLGGGVAMLTGRGGNIGVVTGADGALLIDDQFAPLTPKIEAAVAALGDAPVRFVLNTHWHGDHTGGNENLAGKGATVFAHRNVRLRMSTPQKSTVFQRTTPPSPPPARPLVTYDEGIRFHLSGQEVEVRHVERAHTDGDSIVVIRPANVMHLGDTYSNGSYPFIDPDSGGSFDGLLQAVEEALRIADPRTRIIPGHGQLSNKEELTAYREMLVAVRDAVQREIDAGKSVEEVVAAAPTAKWDPEWGGGFMKPEQFTRIVYTLLSKQAGAGR